MMYGKANISLPGVDITSSSAQTISAEAEKKFAFAENQKIPVSLNDMVASSIGVGPASMESIYKSGSSIVGKVPAIGKTATVASGKITFSS